MDYTLTHNDLVSILDYCPDTGVFTWKRNYGAISMAGKVAGCPNDEGYTIITIKKKSYKAHRLAWMYVHGSFPAQFVDHVNGVRDDNRISNLRDMSNRGNQRNVVAPNVNSKSGLRGASWSKTDRKWRAQIKIGGRELTLGSFDTKEEAHSAYMEAKRMYHPECARAAFSSAFE